ncbi:hypothetical protein ARTSIC4J27_2011 [Pseudarthrobacter siccitolerans]|uniref:Uncharacterized protein n=1 Tax=Pseudarthrobacter siccitolerans TaxID=861266 RepID=A0A024H2V6_9MICC|nr:hypothetical protein ARTSIC4J27_2011 [Pseudarthrobacter siccitolerans]
MPGSPLTVFAYAQLAAVADGTADIPLVNSYLDQKYLRPTDRSH